MLTHWDSRTLPDLLAEHDLTGIPEEDFPNDGWSGARLTLLRRGDRRFVLKRTSWATDWIARATRDHHLREGFIATNHPLGWAPAHHPVSGYRVVTPYLGAAADGTHLALLMPDLSDVLIAWERPTDDPGVAGEVLDRVLDAVALLHATPWRPIGAERDWPWCPVRDRVLLLSRRSAERFRADSLAVGERFVAGWDAFDRLAGPAARDLVADLTEDPAPLLAALDRLPAVALHGDLKLANVALLDDGAVGLIDWQMMTVAPVAVELGWFLVSNAPILPVPPEAVIERYLRAAAAVEARWQAAPSGPRPRAVARVVGDPAAQADLAWIVGLLLRGWRKGLDAEAGHGLPSGVSAADDLAIWGDRAVEAAARRL